MIYKSDAAITAENMKKFLYVPSTGKFIYKSSRRVARSKSPSGEFVLSTGCGTPLQSRAAFFMMGVELSPYDLVEHVNGDISDNRWCNLEVTKKEFNLKVTDVAAKAVNDKYLNYFASLYRYNPETGDIMGRLDTPIKAKGGSYVILSRKINGRIITVAGHRLAMYIMGDDISGLEVDHVNGIRDDNRYSNLRLVSRSLNRRNAARPRNNKTGISGVCWHKHNRRWEVKGGRSTIGYSADFFEACCMRKSWEVEVGGFTDRHGVVGVSLND